MTETKHKPLISPYGRAKSHYWLRDCYHRGAHKTATASKSIIEDVIGLLTYHLWNEGSPVRLDIEIDLTMRPNGTGSRIRSLVIFDGKRTYLSPLHVTQSLVKLDGAPHYVSHPEAGPMLFDAIVQHVELVLAREGATPEAAE